MKTISIQNYRQERLLGPWINGFFSLSKRTTLNKTIKTQTFLWDRAIVAAENNPLICGERCSHLQSITNRELACR
jgi:hypothetical protein